MTKLDALKKLASAYHYIRENTPLFKQGAGPGDSKALTEIAHAFGVVRRSLTLEDLAPSKEGFNGKGPRFF